RLPLRLKLPAELDFGTVQAGTPLTGACQRLDFSASQAAEEHRWQLFAQGLQGCQARPMLRFVNARGYTDTLPLEAGVDVAALDPTKRWMEICLDVPRCAGDVSPEGASLRVAPLTREFAPQTATLRLRWRVVERFPFACHAFWLLPTLGGL